GSSGSFFFPSRRRHTSSKRDWSSDVCSSDLVDRAGNMSKRQSATGVHFSNSGGTCPLWNVYETFAQPGVISRQLAQMPDGRNYLWIARAIRHPQGQFNDTSKLF